MNFSTGDVVLANVIDGTVLCVVKGFNEEGAIELEPVNAETVRWSKCWIKSSACKLVKAARKLKVIQCCSNPVRTIDGGCSSCGAPSL